MRTIALLFALSLSATAQEDPAAVLQKRVEETAKKVSDAFVFLPGGSGVLISADGWFLTNHHVIAPPGNMGAMPKQVGVHLSDSRTFSARVVCTDGVGDIALLKLPEQKEKFPFVEFTDSDKVVPGQYVVAIGNPFGMANEPAAGRYYPSVSLGIVSCVHRFQQQYSDCIQTDAAVNPGNSGGPLVDLEGRLVGINGRIATRYGNRVNSGVGFAISANQVSHFLPEMKKGGIDGRIHHGEIRGLGLSTAHTDGRGAVVDDVRGNAERVGFRKGDLIVAVNGSKVTSMWRFLSLVGIHPNESELTVTVAREGRNSDLKVILDRSTGPDIHGKVETRSDAWFGATVEDAAGGARITFVRPDGPADKGDLQVGDVIVEVDGHKVLRRESVTDRVFLKKPGDALQVKVLRDGKEVAVTVTLGRRPNKD